MPPDDRNKKHQLPDLRRFLAPSGGRASRPGAYSDNDVQRLRGTSVNPDFETLYQQNPDGEWAVHIEPGHFPSFEVRSLPRNLPVVLSIDPGHVAGWGRGTVSSRRGANEEMYTS